jgi:hypothetical protein
VHAGLTELLLLELIYDFRSTLLNEVANAQQYLALAVLLPIAL